LQNFSADGAVYKARGENKDNGQPLNSVGPGQAVLGARWVSPGELYELRLQATFAESWSDRDESGGELFEPRGYALFDLFYTQYVGERMSLRASLSNLTGLTYWNWSEVRGLSPDDPVVPYLAQAGRSLSLSLNLRW
jgi:hemoglobin/transferrin/lactoferrin receptor protein